MDTYTYSIQKTYNYSVPKCDGCEKTTPFYGEIYGRMSLNVHGSLFHGMSHLTVDTNGGTPRTEYDQFNTFKNKLLIPFYGTVLAIRTIYALVRKNEEKWQNIGLSHNLADYGFAQDNKLKYLFFLRIAFALIPGVGTIINGALDIIAHIGVKCKKPATGPIQNDYKHI